MSETGHASGIASRELLPFKNQSQLQSDRLSPLSSLSQFWVEDRHFTDWMRYLRDVASNITFFDKQQKAISSNWYGTIPSEDQARQLQALMEGKAVPADIQALAARADITMLMAFFYMLRYPIAQFQRFTRQHLQYYYRNVLGLTPKQAQPDKAHLVLTLNENALPLTLLAGTAFDGGQDGNGEPLIYKTLSRALISHARLDKIVTLSRLTDGGKLLLTQVQDIDADLTMPEEGIFSFGQPDVQPSDNPAQGIGLTDRQLTSEQGLQIYSSALYLTGGRRELSLNFVLKSAVDSLPIPLSQLFDMSISSAEGFVNITPDTENVVMRWQGNNLYLQFLPLFSAITPVTTGEDESQLNTNNVNAALPSLRFLLKPHHVEISLTKQMRDNLFEAIDLHISVSALPVALAANDGRSLDTSEPFMPFGNAPRTSSTLSFTHPELLCKTIKTARCNFSWLDRPKNWDEHYFAWRVYDTDGDFRVPDDLSRYPSIAPFSATVYYSDVAGAVPLSGETRLFSDNEPVNNVDHHSIHLVELPQPVKAEFNELPFDDTKVTAWPRYFTLKLNSPDFGHERYNQVSQYVNQINARNFNDVNFQPILASYPYTPVLQSLSLDYVCHTRFGAPADQTPTLPAPQQPEPGKGALALQHLSPVGTPGIPPQGTFSLLPKFELRGYMYLAIANIKLPGQVRLYFQLDPVDNVNVPDGPRIDWHYLTNDGWQFFDSSAADSAKIVEDSTFQLLDSGIISFEFPQLQFEQNEIDGRYLWIRVGIAEDSVTDHAAHARYSLIRHVVAQGVEVQLSGAKNAAAHFRQPLAANTIASAVSSLEGVDSIAQPYPSFGARSAESENAFYIRASERLRHKQRALVAWDYERIVLAQFPELYLVRCFADANTESNVEINAATNTVTSASSALQNQQAKVNILVVPNNYNPDILQPKIPLFLKREIAAFVNNLSPDNINVAIHDPNYEVVELELIAQIHTGYDKERVEGELNGILVSAMTPWNRQDDDADMIRSDINLTRLVQVIDSHPALRAVYVLRAKQFTDAGTQYYPDSVSAEEGEKYQQDNLIRPGSAQSILVPAKRHDINLFSDFQPTFEGIEKWRLELDWKVR